MRLVIFDFDGTIHLKETPRLLLHVLSENRLMRIKIIKFYITVVWLYALSRIGLCQKLMIQRVMTGISKVMRGMTESQIDDFFKECLEVAKNSFSPVSLERVKMHIEANDQILLLSGAFSPFISLVAKELGIKFWLGTELELSAGECTGRIKSLLIGTSKVDALWSFLKTQENAGVFFDLDEAYAYADGVHDLPLLTLVGHPVAVNPDHELLKEAQRRGWEIICDA